MTKKLTIKEYAILLISVLILVSLAIITIGSALKSDVETIAEPLGGFATRGGTEVSTFKVLNVLNATTSSATSTPFSTAGAKKVTFHFIRSIGGAGSSTFMVEASVNGTDFVPYNKLVENVANTNAQMLTRVASKVLTATTSAILSVDLLTDGFLALRCIVVESTDGTHTCQALVEY